MRATTCCLRSTCAGNNRPGGNWFRHWDVDAGGLSVLLDKMNDDCGHPGCQRAHTLVYRVGTREDGEPIVRVRATTPPVPDLAQELSQLYRRPASTNGRRTCGRHQRRSTAHPARRCGGKSGSPVRQLPRCRQKPVALVWLYPRHPLTATGGYSAETFRLVRELRPPVQLARTALHPVQAGTPLLVLPRPGGVVAPAHPPASQEDHMSEGLFDAAKRAREKADASTDPADHALAAALEAALDAEARELLRPAPASTDGIESPGDAGYPGKLHIEKPDDET
jgi:hypothetical protein